MHIVLLSQVAVYQAVVKAKAVASLLYGAGAADSSDMLGAITALRKVTNHPGLLLKAGAADDDDDGGGGGPLGRAGPSAPKVGRCHS